MESGNISNTAQNKVVNSFRKSNLFLSSGLLCYITALLLFSFQNKLTSSVFLKKLGHFLTVIADYLWSVPAAIIVILISCAILWFYYHLKREGKTARHTTFLSCLRLSLLVLFLIYTLFPLKWAQRSYFRSLDSFPESTPFDFILVLLGLAGTILCSFYCFEKLPLKFVSLIEKALSRFFRCRYFFFIGPLLIVCLFTTGVITYTVLDHIPHVQDSIAQLFQAKIFKTGKLYAPLPPHKEFFDYTNVINDTKWYSQYPPGHPLLLMLGLFIGAPWLVGPLLGTLSLLLFFLLVKTTYNDHRTLYLSCALIFFSPFFLFMSSNHMNHSSTMFFILLFLLCYIRMFSSHSCLPAIISGLALGYAINIRPLTAVAIGLPFICYLLYCVHKKREVHIKHELCFSATLFLMAVLLLLYNYFTNGNPLLFGYQKEYQTLGFLGNAQVGPPHTLKGGIINTSNNLISLNKHLFEWPLPSLIFVFILFSIPVKKSRWDYLFLSSSLTLIASYFFYYYQDLCFGPRFYYSLTPFMVILSVRGFLSLPVWLEKLGLNKRRTEASLYLLLFFCLLYALLFSLPSLIKKYSNDYWWITDKIHNTVKKQGITNAIVFIDVWHPPHITKPNLIPYGSGFQFNSPDLKDEVIYAIDLKERNIELMKAFPDRHYYLCKINTPMYDFRLIKLTGKGRH